MTDNLIDFISKDVKKYMSENGLEFTDFERAALIYHSGLTVNEKHKRLEALGESTADEALKAQIAERLRVDREDMDAFKNNTEGFVYEALIFDPEAYGEPDLIGFFGAFDFAYSRAEKSGFEFEIKKHKLVGNNNPPHKYKNYYNPYLFTAKTEDECVKECDDDWYFPEAEFKFAKNGEIIWFISREVERGDKETLFLTYDHSRFENAFYSVPDPFEKGDIVSVIANDFAASGRGIVVTSREKYDKLCGRVKRGELNSADYSDVAITVDLLTERGEFSHNHINPAFLEKYKPQEDDDDYYLLLAASELSGSGGSLEWFLDRYEDYKKKHSKK